ncbi:hypothetical protein N7486_011010 [Penicillium sp. IBT 16267x]|nr:hypothetical protein N7486_011010 [Penicillium sp. IBT 16267x]
MPQNALLPQGFLPKESIRLGRFLVDVKEPQVSQHDPNIEKAERDIIVSQDLTYSGDQQAGSGYSFGAALPRLLSISFAKTTNASTAVSATKVTSYKLVNSGSFFKKAVKNPATRLWIEEQHDDNWRNLFFVVGYYTMQDANVLLGAEEGKDVSGQVQIPVSAALAAGGIVLPDGGMTDPEVSIGYEKSRGSKVQFVATGERVCAFQYRKVVFRWFSSRNIDRATLSRDNRWYTVSPSRALQLQEDEEEDDVLEVDLEDDD